MRKFGESWQSSENINISIPTHNAHLDGMGSTSFTSSLGKGSPWISLEPGTQQRNLGTPPAWCLQPSLTNSMVQLRVRGSPQEKGYPSISVSVSVHQSHLSKIDSFAGEMLF